jgi:hypothetical protein
MEERSPRFAVLEEVNAVFRKYGLPEWTELKRIGKHREGEFEITGVVYVWDDVVQYFVYVVFAVIRPDGTPGIYAVRFNQPAAVVVPIINGQVLLVNQHRLARGKWMVEMPRGWLPVEPSWKPEDEWTPVRLILEREVGEEFVQTLKVKLSKKLSSPSEDSGTRGTAVDIYLLIAETETAAPQKHGVHKVIHGPTWEKLLEWVDKNSINDIHSLAAILKAGRFLKK